MRKIRTRKEENNIYDAQEKEIEKECGERDAIEANYGWGVDAYTVSTKVYGYGILSTGYEGKKIVHSWS